MGIVGDVPETGVRITFERARSGGPPWVYRGEVVTADSRHAVAATVSAQGHIGVELPSGAPTSVEPRVRLVLRAAWRRASADGVAPPLRIARWRASE
jgi:hypothetical protein